MGPNQEEFESVSHSEKWLSLKESLRLSDQRMLNLLIESYIKSEENLGNFEQNLATDIVISFNRQRISKSRWCDVIFQFFFEDPSNDFNSTLSEMHVHSAFLISILGESFETYLTGNYAEELTECTKATITVPFELTNIALYCYTGKFPEDMDLNCVEKTKTLVEKLVDNLATRKRMLQKLEQMHNDLQLKEQNLTIKNSVSTSTTTEEMGCKQKRIRKCNSNKSFLYYLESDYDEGDRKSGLSDFSVDELKKSVDADKVEEQKFDVCKEGFVDDEAQSTHMESHELLSNDKHVTKLIRKKGRPKGSSNKAKPSVDTRKSERMRKPKIHTLCHLKEYSKRSANKCCGEIFYNKFRFGIHILNCHSEIVVNCSDCDDLVQIDNLVPHYQTKHDFGRLPENEEKILQKYICNFNVQTEAGQLQDASFLLDVDKNNSGQTRWSTQVECQHCGQSMSTLKYAEHLQDQYNMTKTSMECETIHHNFKCIFAACRLCENAKAPIKLWKLVKDHINQYHLTTSHGDKRDTCDQCGRSVLKHLLKAHKRGHNTSKPQEKVSCDICGKSVFKKRISVHRRTHFDKFSCPHCRKEFNRKENLNVHMRIHTGEKPFVCDVCGKGFRQYVELRLHNRKHEKENTKVMKNVNIHPTSLIVLDSSNLFHPVDSDALTKFKFKIV